MRHSQPAHQLVVDLAPCLCAAHQCPCRRLEHAPGTSARTLSSSENAAGPACTGGPDRRLQLAALGRRPCGTVPAQRQCNSTSRSAPAPLSCLGQSHRSLPAQSALLTLTVYSRASDLALPAAGSVPPHSAPPGWPQNVQTLPAHSLPGSLGSTGAVHNPMSPPEHTSPSSLGAHQWITGLEHLTRVGSPSDPPAVSGRLEDCIVRLCSECKLPSRQGVRQEHRAGSLDMADPQQLVASE